MTKLYTTSFLLLTVSLVSFSQTFSIYTAKSSGLWSNSANWDIRARNDNIKMHKYIIPKSISITVNNDVEILGDIDLNIHGNLGFAGSTNMHLTSGSSITINDGSITGSSANQKIKIGNEIKYKGNVDGVKSGHWLSNSSTGSAPDGFASLLILPGNFTKFNLNRSGNDVELSWSVDTETMNIHYDIERSLNGREWKKIAEVSFLPDNNSRSFNYADKNIFHPVVYYRLRQVNINGVVVYSAVLSVRLKETPTVVKIYGFGKNLVIDVHEPIQNDIDVKIVNSSGKIVTRQSFTNPSGKINVNLTNVLSGTYIVRVTDNKGWSEVKKVIL